MKTATINYQNLVGAFRIDAEVYQPEYLKIEQKLKSIKYKKLGEICKTFKKGIFDINAECYQETGIPFIRISNLKNMITDAEDLVFIPVEENEKSKSTELANGDIVLSKTAYPVASIVTLGKCNVSQDTIAVKLHKDAGVNGKFLVAFLNGRYGLPQMQRWFSGNIQMHLNLIESKDIIVPLLDDTTQDATAKHMDEAILLLEESQKAFKDALLLIDAELRATIPKDAEKWNQEDSTVVLVKNQRWDAEYYHKKYQIVEEQIRKYEYDTFLLDTSHVKDKNHVPKKDKKHRYVQLADIKGDIGIIDGHITEMGKDLPTRARRKIADKDVLLSSLQDSLDKSAIVPEELNGAICSNGFYILNIPDYAPEYLLALIKSQPYQLLFKKGCTGSIMPSLSKNELFKIPFPKVPKDRQDDVIRLIKKSQDAYFEAKRQLKEATRTVEDAIEAT